ncbi:hypothetical protein BB561_006662, partial [Smittium simulii]
CPYKHRCDTWVSGCTRWAKKYNGNINKIKNTIETLNNRIQKNDKSQISKWIADTEVVYPELKTHINYVFKIRNGTYWTAQRYAKSGFIEKRYIEECPFCRNIAPETIEHMLLECSRWQALRADILAQYINIYILRKGVKTTSTRIRKNPNVLCVKTTLATAKFLNAISLTRYIMLNSIRLVPITLNKCSPADTEAGTSCNWMGLELVYPELKTHIFYVFKIRNGTYWTARRYAKSGFIEKRFIEECPFCRNIAPETIEHMLLECSRWQALRSDILAQYINIYRVQVATKHPLLPALISMRLVGKLLGEELKLSSTRICKDPTVLCVKTTLATAKFLNAIALPRYIMLNSIRLAPIPPNQCPPGTETLVSQRRVNR